MNIDHFAAHPVGGAGQFEVVTCVLEFCQASQDGALVHPVTAHQVQHHAEVGTRIAQPVDRRYRGHQNGIAAFQQRLGGRQAHLFDMFVDRGIFFDKGVRSRNVGFRLVIIVIGDKILHRIMRKELLHLSVQLRGERLVGCHNQGRTLHLLHHVGDGEGFAGAGDAQQGLLREPGLQAFDQLPDRLGLVTRRGHITNKLKFFAHRV